MLNNAFEPPIQQILLPEFNQNGVAVFIKREDLFHPFISGNKWRKLKYVLHDAKLKNKTHLVSFGGAYSNHLLALANAGASFGFKTTGFVRGEEVNNHMLGLCKTFGMQLIFTNRSDYQNKKILYNDFALENPDTYFIDEGGKGELAAKGCEEILADVTDFTYVLCAVGTGTTLAGIAKFAHKKNIIAEGICVLKGAEEIEKEVQALAGISVKIHTQFHCGGYAKTTPELYHFMDYFSEKTGILLDQVYTGKLMWGVKQLIDETYFKPGSKILVIHTGGLLGLLSRYKSLQ